MEINLYIFNIWPTFTWCNNNDIFVINIPLGLQHMCCRPVGPGMAECGAIGRTPYGLLSFRGLID